MGGAGWRKISSPSACGSLAPGCGRPGDVLMHLDAVYPTPRPVLKGLKREAAQRLSKSLSSGFVLFHAQFLSFSPPCVVSPYHPPPVLLGRWAHLGVKWSLMRSRKGSPGPVAHAHVSGSESHCTLTFSACPSQRGQRRFIVNGRALSFPLCLGGGSLKKHPNSGHLCSSDSQKACTQHQPSPLPKTSKQFLFKKLSRAWKVGVGEEKSG